MRTKLRYEVRPYVRAVDNVRSKPIYTALLRYTKYPPGSLSGSTVMGRRVCSRRPSRGVSGSVDDRRPSSRQTTIVVPTKIACCVPSFMSTVVFKSNPLNSVKCVLTHKIVLGCTIPTIICVTKVNSNELVSLPCFNLINVRACGGRVGVFVCVRASRCVRFIDSHAYAASLIMHEPNKIFITSRGTKRHHVFSKLIIPIQNICMIAIRIL